MSTMWPVKNYGRRNGPSPLPEGLIPADLRPKKIRNLIDNGRRNFNGLGQAVDVHEISHGPASVSYDVLPIDLHPRLIQEYQRNPDGTISPASVGLSPLEMYLRQIAEDTGMISSTIVLNRGLIGRTVTVTTTPQRIITAEFLRGYILLNPNELAGATSAGTLLASSLQVGGASGFSSTLGVANFLGAHYFVDISARVAPATLTVTLQALDPASGQFADVQDLVTGAILVDTTYAFVDALGTPTDIRVSWSVGGGGGSVTFSVGFVLKNGLIGTSAGISQTIFLGGAEVTTASGFPLLNGQSQKFFLRENLQLWAVANASLPLKIFEL